MPEMVMNEGDLFCNAKQCHDLLTSVAWVTSCSHIFCEQDGQRHLNQGVCVCPACGTSLSFKGSVKRIELDPSDQLKNMMLAGFKPDIIMDICSRGLGFWTYQMDKERQREHQKVDQLRSQILELEKYYEKILNENNTEIMSIKRQLQNSKKKMAAVMEQKDSISLRLGEKNRQYQKLQNLYDSLRRHASLHPVENSSSRFLARPVRNSDNVPSYSHSQPPNSQFRAGPPPPAAQSFCDSILNPFSSSSLPNFDSAPKGNHEMGVPGEFGLPITQEGEVSFTTTNNFEFFPVTSSAFSARGAFKMTNAAVHNGANNNRQDP